MAVALLTSPEGEAEADDEGLPGVVEVLELPAGCVAQPAAAIIERTIISLRAIGLIMFIGVSRFLLFLDMMSVWFKAG